MADGPFAAEDAATDPTVDGDSRLRRERHKRQDACSPMTSLSTGQDAARRVHEDATILESDSRRRQHHLNHHHQHYPPPPRRNCHGRSFYVHRRHRGVGNNNNNNINNNLRPLNHHCHRENDVQDGRVGTEIGEMPCVFASTSPTCLVYDDGDDEDDDEEEEEEEEEEDEDEEEEDDDDEDDEEEEEEEEREGAYDETADKYRGVRVEATKPTKKDEVWCNDNSNASNKTCNSGADGAATSRDNDAASAADGRLPRSVVLVDSNTTDDDRRVSHANDDDDEEEDDDEDASEVQKVNSLVHKNEVARGEKDAVTMTAEGTIVVSDGSGDSGGGGAAGAVSASGGGAAGAAGVTANGLVAARHQGSPFKGQVRMAEDTLVGPCGKKRCADRYDSSESSDSGVAVSCGECSSSGTSDITEPGSPCSTSSDEGVAIRGASASPLPSLPKLAPSSQISTRPQWPWTPPLAATACSTYKRLKGEPEAGALPRSGAADPTSRGTTKANGKSNIGHHHHHHESQGKITEYFKTQIKPQQPKIKKTSEMSVLVAKSSTEFRRPPTVQRNKGGLAKYLGAVSQNGRGTSTNDWEVRTLTMSPPPTKKPSPVVVPRANGKMEKKLAKPMPSLPISNDVLKTIPNCKITSLRLPSEVCSNAKNNSSSSTPAPSLTTEPLDFKGCILSKPHVNENNNLTNGCGGILGSLRSQGIQDPLSRLSVPEDTVVKGTQASAADEDDVEEEEEDSRSSESKPPLSPILSAPTTIRFPVRVPGKDRQQGADSGICRWDKCEASFESSGGLLEHLQAAHINTQTGGDNFVCHWQGCKVQGRSSCSRRWLERHVLSHGGNKPFRCIVDGCGSRFSSQTALERHVNGHFNQPETSSSSGRRSCESGGKLVRRNGKRLRYRRQPWSARLFDYFDSGVMEGLQHRLLELAKSRTQGRLAETPGNSMALTSQVLARRVELDGRTKVLLRWYPPDIEPDEWVLESEVRSTKNVGIRKVASANPEEVNVALYSAMNGNTSLSTRGKQRRKPVKNS